MVEMDGKKLCQTTAIMNYIGAKFNLQPKDPLLKHKGEKIVAYWCGDVVNDGVMKINKAKEED